MHWLYGAAIDKVEIIPPGVDLIRFSPTPREIAREALGIPDEHKNILYAGRIERLKGIDTLLLAMALIHRFNPEVVDNVCVSIIGGDPWNDDADEEMSRLQEMRKELNVSDIVTFLGAKDQDRATQLLCGRRNGCNAISFMKVSGWLRWRLWQWERLLSPPRLVDSPS